MFCDRRACWNARPSEPPPPVRKPTWTKPLVPARASARQRRRQPFFLSVLLLPCLRAQASARSPRHRQFAWKLTSARQRPKFAKTARARRLSAQTRQALAQRREGARGRPARKILPQAESADAGARLCLPTIFPAWQTCRLLRRYRLWYAPQEFAIYPSSFMRGEQRPRLSRFARFGQFFPRRKRVRCSLSQIFPRRAHLANQPIAPLAAAPAKA